MVSFFSKIHFYNRFSKVASEILAEKIPSRAYYIFMLACSITNILYSKQLRNVGWTSNNIDRLNNLTWKHAIMAEEYYGLDFCAENLEYSTHIAKEIQRHSSPDNYSCELYERQIRSHKLQKHNAKGLEKTYAERESIKHFLKVYQQKNGPLSKYEQAKAYSFDVQAALDKGEPFFLRESSIAAATALIADIGKVESQQIQQALSNGVTVGKVRQHEISRQQRSDIRRYFSHKFPDVREILLPDIAMLLSSVVTVDEVGEMIKVAKGCTCAIAGGENETEEWVMEIKQIIQVGPVQVLFYIY